MSGGRRAARRKRAAQASPTPSQTGRPRSRRRLILVLASALVLIAAASAAAGLAFRDGGGGSDSAGPKRAVIVDQLSLTSPGPEFVDAATKTLEFAGYTVDYVPGEDVTVEFYKRLPELGYDFVILRAHSGVVREINAGTDEATVTEDISLFTGEPFDETKYGSREEAGRLGVGRAYYYEDGPGFFGITSRFVESTMRGDFQGATVVLMGCDGLSTTKTAEAFVARGARTFISWSQPVLAERTDTATERLLAYLLVDQLSTDDALARTMEDVGPDPDYGSVLRSYP